jgi:hypothetical protein
MISSTICLLFDILFYLYKKKGYNLIRTRIFLILNFIFCIISLIANLPFFLLTNSEVIFDSINQFIIEIINFNLAIVFLVISIILYLLNFFKIETRIIDLEGPSYTTSKKGEIKIGNVIQRKARKHSFLLPVRDLEKHMFICGSTGTGKSNFLQNFLLNYKKSYDIPFFLVEFKGEYHFLQEKIQNLLIL